MRAPDGRRCLGMRQAAALGKLPTGPGGVGLVVIDQDGTEHPGWRLRAGDYVEATEYNHDTRVVFARVGAVPLPLRLRLRRWWEGWRRRQERWGG